MNDLVVSRLGPPLESEIANRFPTDRVDEMSDRCRGLYAEGASVILASLLEFPDHLAALNI